MFFTKVDTTLFNLDGAVGQADALLALLTKKKTALGDVVESADCLSLKLGLPLSNIRDAGAMLLLRGDLDNIIPVGNGRALFVFPKEW